MNSSAKYKVRKEVHLDEQTINGLTKIASKHNRSLKNLMESILIEELVQGITYETIALWIQIQMYLWHSKE